MSSKKLASYFKKFSSVLLPKGFRVTCDSTNNTPEDIKAGRVNVAVELEYTRIPITSGGDS